ncbi:MULTISPECIES: hypothetical protein [Clavibacter]|uniref:Uncharacterized protein n=2 Tax=Clavibacter TaxID=1573 RepID=A0A399NSL6_9MICO|nr:MULTISPECIES: hypothetical protein [Clavibacter]KDP92213.1 hypothetical protein W824_04070 [Clavibacter cf. michiganensis LMG 26808]RII96727.1 hypothetical protein DZF96_10230 [Clavibacter michiganensis]UKF24863.1 hypothetical protein KYT88_14275 [Clavibacter sp. A6099]
MVPMARVLRAEKARWRRDVSARIPWAGLVVGGGLGLLSSGASVSPGWTAVLAWLNPWAVFVGPMLAVLVVAVSLSGDRASRGGGTWWRPVARWQMDAAKSAISALFILMTTFGAVAGVLAVGTTHEAIATLPWARVAEVVATLWAGSVSIAAVIVRVGRRLGLLASLGIGAVWCVVGALAAESPFAFAVPPAWAVRATIPLFGTHSNGITLPPGSPLAQIDPLPWSLACIGFAVLVVTVRRREGGLPGVDHLTAVPAPVTHGEDRAPRIVLSRPSEAWQPRRAGREASSRSVARATLVALRRTPLWIVPLVTTASVLLITRWQPPTRVLQVVPLAVVPVVASVTPLIVWGRLRPAWRAVATRPVALVRPALAAATLTALVTSCSVVVPLLVLGAVGVDSTRVRVLVAMCALTGVMWTCVQLVLTIAAGRVVATAAGIIGTFISLLIGGSVLADRFWRWDPWSWGRLTEPTRVAFAVPVMIATTALSCLALGRVVRRVAAR